jgi:tetratricopeptide (TPR) repeat protein
LQKSIEEGGSKDDGGVGVLESIAQLIQGQVAELRNKGDQEGLGKAIDGFSVFLDDLVKQQKTMTPELARILAMCYASLEKHDRAIELLEKITEPKAVSGKEPESALVENYRAARILYIRELRQDKKLDKAEAALKDILKTDWGKQSFEVKKESLLQLDAQGQHMRATKEWDEIISKQLLPKMNENATIKDQYFECNVYYLTAFLHYVQGQKEEAKRIKYTRQLAVQMVKLEKAWPDLGGPVTRSKILGLLDEDAKLKEQVNEVKKGSN